MKTISGHQMKPETIARHAAERVQARTDRKANLIARLQSAVAQYGQDSIYAEMLAEMLEAN